MHFFSILLVLAAATINAVSGATVCYPSPCGTYTNQYPATTEDQLTTWATQNIGLDKFDKDAGTLTKVTIKTVVKFNTSVYITCTANVTFCDNEYKGEASGGIEFGMDLASTDAGKLPDYWGRWGDYPYSGDYNAPGSPPNPDESIDVSNGGVPMFVPYTYPLFDVDGFVPQKVSVTDGSCQFNECTVWAYYVPTTDKKRITFYYDDLDSTTVVSYDPNQNGYLQLAGAPAKGFMKYKFGQGTSFVTTKDTRVRVGRDVYDLATPNTPLVKSISITDPDGGLTQTVKAQDMLNLFQDTTPGSQIFFTANAKGVVAFDDIGGNAIRDQETYAFVQMAIEYEYDAAVTQQDPQFVGFQGQSFQVHGYPGSYFHLVSAPSFQMNGRFAYLANGHCHYKHTPCWTHPGTYIDDVTLIVDELLVRITAGPVGTGYSVRINDEPFHAHSHGVNETSDHTDVREFVPTKFYDAATRLTVHLRSPLLMTIRTDLFAFTFHNADHFFNIDSQILVRPILAAGREASSRYPHPSTGAPWFPEYPIHGFIGQTWANATYAHKKLYQGDVDDYVETRPYSTESIYSQYSKKFDDKDMHWE